MEIDWATAGQPHTTGTAWLNGKKIRVMLDTGASTSMLSRSAAERAGVTPDSPGVVKSGRMRGIGSRAVDTWIAPFESFRIGDEEIRNTKLRIGDTSLEQDMLVGADFFLSHRIYVASSQRKMYFTFNGGPVFNLADRPPPGAEPDDEAPQTADAPQPEVPEGTPTDAAGFSRRGAAFAARRDYQHALEDLTRACELAPAEPEYFYERGRAYLGNRQPAMAVADFDQVIRLKPDHVPALVTRAGMNMARLEQGGQKFDATAVLADLNKASASAPKEDDVHLELGTLYSRLGAFGPAIAQYDMWLDTHPTEARTPEAYASRCRSRALMGLELDKALSDCNRAVRAHDDAPFFLDSRGMVHLRMGNYDKAIADYDAALKIQPKNPWALYGRGLAELKKGRKAEGEAQIAAAKAAAPRIVAEAERRGLIP
jgi:tetratricopeptide (TPR) repeat protein